MIRLDLNTNDAEALLRHAKSFKPATVMLARTAGFRMHFVTWLKRLSNRWVRMASRALLGHFWGGSDGCTQPI